MEPARCGIGLRREDDQRKNGACWLGDWQLRRCCRRSVGGFGGFRLGRGRRNDADVQVFRLIPLAGIDGGADYGGNGGFASGGGYGSGPVVGALDVVLAYGLGYLENGVDVLPVSGGGGRG